MSFTNKQILEAAVIIGTGFKPSQDYINATNDLYNELVKRGERKAYCIFKGQIFKEFDTLAEARREQDSVPVCLTILDLTGECLTNTPKNTVVGILN